MLDGVYVILSRFLNKVKYFEIVISVHILFSKRSSLRSQIGKMKQFRVYAGKVWILAGDFGESPDSAATLIWDTTALRLAVNSGHKQMVM